MIRVLMDAKKLKERYHPFGKLVPMKQITRMTKRYRRALAAGYAMNPVPLPPAASKPGKRKRGKVLCLLDRLRTREQDTLRFLSDPNVPLENNQAESDLLMAKVQQKVYGDFARKSGRIYLRAAVRISTPCVSRSRTLWRGSCARCRGMPGN
jgi:transposase